MNKLNKNRQGYIKTKVGWIPEEWECVWFRNLGDGKRPVIKAGPFGSSLKKEFYVENGYKIYGQEQVIAGDPLYGDYFIDEKRFQFLRSCEVLPGDILLSLVGTIGKALLVPPDYQKGIINPRLLRISLDRNRIAARYAKYYLETEHTLRLLNSWAQGGTMGVLNAQIVGSLPIPLPPLPEQKKIAEILSTWDRAIEQVGKLIDAKEKRFKRLVQILIANQSDNWDHLKGKEMFDSISEKDHPDEELLSVTQDRSVIPRIMLEGKVMSPEGSTATYKLIKEGDFVISLRSFQGGIEYSNYQGIISPAYTVLRPTIELHANFYRHFFKTYLFIEKYLRIAVIGIRDGKQISIPDFMTVKIPCPPLEQQKEIAEILSIAQYEIDILKKLAEAYRKQKRGLMQKLLTGQWRVKTGKEVNK
jgi:type I restriction enzyme S subunit